MVLMKNKLVLIILILIFILIIYLKKQTVEKFENPVTDVYSILKDESCDPSYTTMEGRINSKHKICYKNEDNKPGVVLFNTSENCDEQQFGFINESIKSKSNYIGCFINSNTNEDKEDMTTENYYNTTNNNIDDIFKTKEDCKTSANNNYYAMSAAIPDDVDIDNLVSNISTDPTDRKAFCKPISEIPNIRRTSNDKCDTIVNLGGTGNSEIKDYLGGFKDGEEYIAIYQKNNSKHSDFYPNDNLTSRRDRMTFSLADITNMKDKCKFYCPMTEPNSQYARLENSNWEKIPSVNTYQHRDKYILRDYSGNDNHILIKGNGNADNLNRNFAGIMETDNKYGLKFSQGNYADITGSILSNLLAFESGTNTILVTYQVYINSDDTNPLYGQDYFFGSSPSGRNRGVPLLALSKDYRNNDSFDINNYKYSYYSQHKYAWALLGNTPAHNNFYTKMNSEKSSNHTKNNDKMNFKTNKAIVEGERIFSIVPFDRQHIRTGTGHSPVNENDERESRVCSHNYPRRGNYVCPENARTCYGGMYNIWGKCGPNKDSPFNQVEPDIEPNIYETNNTGKSMFIMPRKFEKYNYTNDSFNFDQGNQTLFNLNKTISGADKDGGISDYKTLYLKDSRGHKYRLNTRPLHPVVFHNANGNQIKELKYIDYMNIDPGFYPTHITILEGHKVILYENQNYSDEIISLYGPLKYHSLYDTFYKLNHRHSHPITRPHNHPNANDDTDAHWFSNLLSFRHLDTHHTHRYGHEHRLRIPRRIIRSIKIKFLPVRLFEHRYNENPASNNRSIWLDYGEYPNIQTRDGPRWTIIQVCEGTNIILYKEANFGGASYTYRFPTNSTTAQWSRLKLSDVNFNDQVNSIKIVCSGCTFKRGDNENHAPVILDDGGGRRVTYDVGYHLEIPRRTGSGISKVKVDEGYTVTLFQEPNFLVSNNWQGRSWNKKTIVGPTNGLVHIYSDNDLRTFHDDIGAIIVERNINSGTSVGICKCIATGKHYKVRNYDDNYNQDNMAFGCHGYSKLIKDTVNYRPPVKGHNRNTIWNIIKNTLNFNDKGISHNNNYSTIGNENTSIHNTVTCPNVDKMTSATNSGDFIPEKISSSNFVIHNPIHSRRWERISFIFTKEGNNVNIKIKKNNSQEESTINNIPIGDLTNPTYKLYIGRLLDHSSNISIRDFRIYENLDNSGINNIISKMANSDNEETNNHADNHRKIVNELMRRETELFNEYERSTASNKQATVNEHMNDIDKLFTFKRELYLQNNNSDGATTFNNKMCMKKVNNMGYTSIRREGTGIGGDLTNLNYDITVSPSNNAVDPGQRTPA